MITVSVYEIRKGYSRQKTTWRSGAMQRGPGVRYFVYRDGVRQYVVCGKATSQGGFFRRAVAEAWVAQRERSDATALGVGLGFFPDPAPSPPF